CPPKCRDRVRGVAASFELHAEVILRLWIFGIEVDGFAELGEGARVITLAAQRHTQQRVGRRIAGMKTEGAAKLGRGTLQIAELSLGQPQLKMHLRRRVQLERLLQLALRRRRIVLLQINACQESMYDGAEGSRSTAVCSSLRAAARSCRSYLVAPSP